MNFFRSRTEGILYIFTKKGENSPLTPTPTRNMHSKLKVEHDLAPNVVVVVFCQGLGDSSSSSLVGAVPGGCEGA